MLNIQKVENFEEIKENWFKQMEGNEQIKNIYESTHFKVGQKLCLDIVITDEYLSNVIYRMLFKTEHGQDEGFANLGFDLNAIHLRPHDDTARMKIINELETLAHKLRNNDL